MRGYNTHKQNGVGEGQRERKRKRERKIARISWDGEKGISKWDLQMGKRDTDLKKKKGGESERYGKRKLKQNKKKVSLNH